jgi:hypothetical protein
VPLVRPLTVTGEDEIYFRDPASGYNRFNGTSSTIYLFALFNSGGLNSGTVNNDSFTIVPFSPRVVTGTITNFNQGIISNGLSIPPNTSYDITLNKNDGLLSGTTLRLAFSYNPSGLPTFNVTF